MDFHCIADEHELAYATHQKLPMQYLPVTMHRSLPWCVQGMCHAIKFCLIQGTSEQSCSCACAGGVERGGAAGATAGAARAAGIHAASRD